MRWEDWKPLYMRIVDALELNPTEDKRATSILTSILIDRNPQHLLQRLKAIIENRKVVICGAGPSLENHLGILSSDQSAEDYVYVAADGALEGILEFNISCSVIVTDLDGDRGNLVKSTKQGAIAIVHAHGDNIHTIQQLVPKMDNVIGSTQVEPTERAFLWGGFTDGDRACYIVNEFGPQTIILAGMDFGEVVGKFSKPEYSSDVLANERKMTKLKIGQWLTKRLIDSTSTEFVIL